MFEEEGFDPIMIGDISGQSQVGLSLMTAIITYYLANEVNDELPLMWSTAISS
jgi:hypothetical protein